MVFSPSSAEPLLISDRFYVTLEQKAATLEANANSDELVAATLDHPDHRRRQLLLVEGQREHAAILREFLADVKIKPAA